MSAIDSGNYEGAIQQNMLYQHQALNPTEDHIMQQIRNFAVENEPVGLAALQQ